MASKKGKKDSGPARQALSTLQAASLCGVARSTVLRWLGSGLLKSYRTAGGQHRIRRQDLVRFMRQHNMPLPGFTDGERPRVVIVDGDRHYVTALSRIIKRELPEAEVRVAHDGFDGGWLVSGFRPHVLFLDIVMPALDGMEVCRRIMQEQDMVGTRVIVHSGHLTESWRQALTGLGVDALLDKPAEPAQIIETLHWLLKPTKGHRIRARRGSR